MSATAEAVLSTLRGLPRGVVDDVRKRINAYLQFGAWGGERTEPREAPVSEGRHVFRILCEEMAVSGLADPSELSYLRIPNRSIFDQQATKLIAFVRGQSGDRMVQDTILRVGVQLLIRHLQDFASETEKFVLTVAIVLRNIDKVPARLDRAFPGYGACKMLHLLAMSRS